MGSLRKTFSPPFRPLDPGGKTREIANHDIRPGAAPDVSVGWFGGRPRRAVECGRQPGKIDVPGGGSWSVGAAFAAFFLTYSSGDGPKPTKAIQHEWVKMRRVLFFAHRAGNGCSGSLPPPPKEPRAGVFGDTVSGGGVCGFVVYSHWKILKAEGASMRGVETSESGSRCDRSHSRWTPARDKRCYD